MGDIETNEGAADTSLYLEDKTDSVEDETEESRSSEEKRAHRLKKVGSFIYQIRRESDFQSLKDWPNNPILLQFTSVTSKICPNFSGILRRTLTSLMKKEIQLCTALSYHLGDSVTQIYTSALIC
jgi:hypothetical protein